MYLTQCFVADITVGLLHRRCNSWNRNCQYQRYWRTVSCICHDTDDRSKIAIYPHDNVHLIFLWYVWFKVVIRLAVRWVLTAYFVVDWVCSTLWPHSCFWTLEIPCVRSLNDGECSADWYNFQESVAHLQLLEEEVLESHKNLVDSMEHWMNQDISLLAMSNEVDYDQDGESSMFLTQKRIFEYNI